MMCSPAIFINPSSQRALLFMGVITQPFRVAPFRPFSSPFSKYLLTFCPFRVINEKEKTFVIAGVLVSSDKFIDRAYAEKVRRFLNMTKVFQILEEEKQDAINRAVNKTKLEGKRQIAESMLLDGEDIVKIMRYTKLSHEEVEEIQNSMLITS